MRTWNFSLASLLAIVTLLCFDLGALVSDSRLATAAAYTAFVGLLCFAASAALATPASARAYWVGFAVFGFVYWWAAFDGTVSQAGRGSLSSWGGINPTAPNQPPAPAFLSGELLDLVEENLAPQHSVGSHVYARWQGGGYYWGTVLSINGSQYQIKWDDGSSPTWQGAHEVAGASPNRRVALQAIVATLWSLGGGAIVAFWLGRRKPAEADASKTVAKA